jgi:hypothetical protein
MGTQRVLRFHNVFMTVFVMGCWTSAPGRDSVVASADRIPSSSARALASQLAEELRDREDTMFVERFVDRQLVVLELENETLQVLCDAQTLTAAVRFSELLNDPDRSPASCTPIVARTAGFVCTQGAATEYLRLDFTRVDDAWRLVGGVLPRGPGPKPGDGGALIRKYLVKLDVAACPP